MKRREFIINSLLTVGGVYLLNACKKQKKTNQDTDEKRGDSGLYILAINGSPRKNWNTAKLLKSALNGAEAQGAETELLHLYDYNFKGCYSCLACKRKDKPAGFCSYPDELQQVLEKIKKADGVILGSPIYYGTDSAVMRALVERLTYPFLFRPCPYKKPFATIYNMGMDDIGKNPGHNATSPQLFKSFFGSCDTMTAYGTYQYDYDVYDGFRTNEERKPKSEKQFPIDLQKAYEIGKRMALRIQKS